MNGFEVILFLLTTRLILPATLLLLAGEWRHRIDLKTGHQ